MELLEAELELQSHESLWVNGSGEAARDMCSLKSSIASLNYQCKTIDAKSKRDFSMVRKNEDILFR